ncbi:hypothetical protein [Pluralibacter gergoviae]|uniref:hypothetical protein n=1 Tax=Pluralibacter gergoviae TaxID=61647 RepID=UPI00388E34AC
MNKSTITREQLIKNAQEQIEFCRHTKITGEGYAHVNQCAALFEIALSAIDSEPVAWLAIYHGEVYDEAIGITRSVVEAQADHFGWESALTEIIPLYRHAQPAPVVNGEYGDAYQGAREDLAIWKRRALEAEESVRRLEQINDHLVKEAQGESRMGEPVIAQPVPVVPDEIKHRIGGLDWGWEGEFNRGWNACRAAMLNGGKS